jgi:hypothetical protein
MQCHEQFILVLSRFRASSAHIHIHIGSYIHIHEKYREITYIHDTMTIQTHTINIVTVYQWARAFLAVMLLPAASWPLFLSRSVALAWSGPSTCTAPDAGWLGNSLAVRIA